MFVHARTHGITNFHSDAVLTSFLDVQCYLPDFPGCNAQPVVCVSRMRYYKTFFDMLPTLTVDIYAIFPVAGVQAGLDIAANMHSFLRDPVVPPFFPAAYSARGPF